MDHSKRQAKPKVFIDTNIILDVLLKRKPFYDESKRIVDLCRKSVIFGYVSQHSVATIWYVIRREFEDATCRTLMMSFLSFLDIAGAKKDQILAAVNNDTFPDFEDCLQDECAFSVDADYIITRNKKDFAAAKVQAVYPEEFVVA